ncbi:Ser-Thr-rich glycosyl-phosphatidyl-inositol-anchored membrane family-domain-containing protein [Zychaea mexicana]|uniref:Ser-Thr-rich glycosyl-phosphatidyl-inositol-anchored membrane family-domain-containing protein n=1 Tax=Zychaea mexicana TaxID=64656 RepID=UPI0022FE7DA9|nr:Ser-Thr-rich glycosyl-phosphatidyl-inositol-anchored membrane family-domain-containing protein [Zychaea mexicana]KAI9489754.1 Ser-Thr-rich glycosyl-phosphatidyl-inositol-anchored membrane family-domain-containing protein [Zychaea mexicana]
MKSIVAAIAALAVASVSAQQANIVSITSPLEGTTYTAGQEATISWINPTVDTISKIVLAKGSATALQPVADVASNVDAKAGSYKWTVPADIAPGNDYAFELGQSPNLAFTGHFTIKAGDGSSSNSTSSSAASSGSSPSASASSDSKPSSGSSASASGSNEESSEPSSSDSAGSAEESADSAAGKVVAAPIALALAGAVAAGLL